MGVKFGISFGLRNENERTELREKFERHMGLNDTTKDHFERLVNYFNYHKKDIESSIEMEKRVIPSFFYRIVDGDKVLVNEVRNENFPASVTFYDRILELKANWFYQVKEFIKKYKIVNEPVFLNIEINTKMVYITIENINKGDEEMAETKKRYIIGFNYYDEQERNTQKSRVEAISNLHGSLNNGLKFMLDTTEMFIDEDGHINTDLLEATKEASEGHIGCIISRMNKKTEDAFQSEEFRDEILDEFYGRIHNGQINIVVTGMPKDLCREYRFSVHKDKGLKEFLTFNEDFVIKGENYDKGNTLVISSLALYNNLEWKLKDMIRESESLRSLINMGMVDSTTIHINVNYDRIARKSFIDRLLNRTPKVAIVNNHSLYGVSIAVNFN